MWFCICGGSAKTHFIGLTTHKKLAVLSCRVKFQDKPVLLTIQVNVIWPLVNFGMSNCFNNLHFAVDMVIVNFRLKIPTEIRIFLGVAFWSAISNQVQRRGWREGFCLERNAYVDNSETTPYSTEIWRCADRPHGAHRLFDRSEIRWMHWDTFHPFSRTLVLNLKFFTAIFLTTTFFFSESFSGIPTVNLLRGIPCFLDMQSTGCPSPPSYVPRFFTGLTDKMDFKQRVINTLVNTDTVFQSALMAWKAFSAKLQQHQHVVWKWKAELQLVYHPVIFRWVRWSPSSAESSIGALTKLPKSSWKRTWAWLRCFQTRQSGCTGNVPKVLPFNREQNYEKKKWGTPLILQASARNKCVGTGLTSRWSFHAHLCLTWCQSGASTATWGILCLK